MAGHGSFHVFFRALLAFVLVMSLCCSSDSAARPIHEPASQRFGLPPFSRGVRGAGFRFPRLPQGPVPPKGPSIGVVPSPPPPPTLFSSFSHGVDGSHRFPMLPKGPVPPSGPSTGDHWPPPPPILFSSFSHGVDRSHRFPMLPKGPVPPSGPSKGDHYPPPAPNSLS